MIDLNEYDTDLKDKTKNKVFYNENEELISSSKDDISSYSEKPSLNKSNSINNEYISNEASDSEGPAIDKQAQEIRFNQADIGELLEDEENDQINNDKLNELLFCAQGIGNFTDKKNNIYEKDEYCEPSLRDIHRFLRNDDKENPIYKYSILNWNIAESDVIPCLLAYENNDKISQLCLVILCDLTEELNETVENRIVIEGLMFKLLNIMLRNGVVELLARFLNDHTQQLMDMEKLKEELKKEMENEKNKNVNNNNNNEKNNNENNNNENNNINDNNNENNNNIENNNENNNINDNNNDNKEINLDTTKEDHIIMKRKIGEIQIKSEKIVELIFVLLKQMLSITSTNNLLETSNTLIILLEKISNLKILDALIFYTSGFNDIQNHPFTNTISSTLLSIVFLIIRLFYPKSIIEISDSEKENKISEKSEKEFKILLENEEFENSIRKSMLSSRPNCFGTRIRVNRPIDNSSYIVNNISQILNKNVKNLVQEKSNTFKTQRHRSNNKKKTIFKDKRIPKFMINTEVKLINDYQIKNYFNSTNLFEKNIECVKNIKKFLENFLDKIYNSFISFYYYQLGKEDELDKFDIYYLMNIISFFIEFNRFENYNKIKKNNNEKFDLTLIALSLSTDMINYIYNKLYEQSLAKKIERQTYMIFPYLNCLKQNLYCLFDSYKFSKHNDFNLTVNVILQDSLLTKDYSKIIKSLFEIYNDQYHPIDILYDIIEFTEIYFSDLEFFTKKRKELKIQAKKKKRRREINDEKDLLNEKKLKKILGEKNNSSESENDYSEDEYISREIDTNSESKILIDYEIIEKIMSIFKNYGKLNSFELTKNLNNIKNSNKDILKFIINIFNRIVNKTNCDWIFYNMENLLIFNTLLNNDFFQNDKAYEPLKKIIKQIINNYFEKYKKNKMLPIESLFHFNNLVLIQSILNNYEDENNNKLNESDIDFNINEDNNNNDSEGEAFYKEDYLLELNEKKIEKKIKKNKNKEIINDEDEDNLNNSFEKMEIEIFNIELDKLLIKLYFDNINPGQTNYNEVIDIIKSNEKFSNIDIKDIKNRLHKLKVKKGKEKSLKKLNKIYNKNNNNSNKENNENKYSINDKIDYDSLANCVYNLSEKISNETFRNSFNLAFSSIKKQIDSYKKRKILLGNELNNNLDLIPTNQNEIEMFNDEDFIKLLLSCGFEKKENYISLNKNFDVLDIEIIYDKLSQCGSMVNENIIEENKERNEKKEEHKKNKKIKKNKFLGNYYIEYTNNNDNINNENNNNNNKKKKKLKKHKINPELESIKENKENILNEDEDDNNFIDINNQSKNTEIEPEKQQTSHIQLENPTN